MMPISAALVALGWAWWCFWLYRTHQRFAQMTSSNYPVKPGPAVGFHFIPLYNLYWVFHWTRPFTQFCDRLAVLGPPQPAAAQSPSTKDTLEIRPGWWPGIFLCFALLNVYGVFLPRDYLLREFETMPPSAISYLLQSLLIALGVATYLDRRLTSALSPAAPPGSASKPKSIIGI